MKIKVCVNGKSFYFKNKDAAFLFALQKVEEKLREGDRLITQRHEVFENLEFYQWVTDGASVEVWIIY